MTDPDDDFVPEHRPPKRRATLGPGHASSTSSSSSSPTSRSFFPPPASQSHTGLTVDVHSKQEKGVSKKRKLSVEESPPTTPSTAAAAEEKLKGGAKQMSDLLKAIKDSQLSETQGKNWKDKKLKKGKVTEYLQERLADQISRCKHRSAFDYLRDHNIDSQPDKVKEYIDTLDAKYGKCLVTDGSGYPQLKVPCSTMTVSSSDARAGKSIGLLQIQTYNLAVILDEIKTDDELIVALEHTIADAARARTVGGHLCKRVCLRSTHISNVSANVNVKFHESCPGMWVIKDKLISFCHCPVGSGNTCMAPGGLFQASASCVVSMRTAVESVIVNTSNVEL